MAGIGKYKKGARFTLKSGNKPTFAQMGSSPTNLNNFGIGKGTSPYRDDNEDDDKKEKGWKKALKVGAKLLAGGLENVYGDKKTSPGDLWEKWSKERKGNGEEDEE